jgi:hypothetical protein
VSKQVEPASVRRRKRDPDKSQGSAYTQHIWRLSRSELPYGRLRARWPYSGERSRTARSAILSTIVLALGLVLAIFLLFWVLWLVF